MSDQTLSQLFGTLATSAPVEKTAADVGGMEKTAAELVAAGKILGTAIINTMQTKLAAMVAAGGTVDTLDPKRSRWEAAAKRQGELKGETVNIEAKQGGGSITAEEAGALAGSKDTNVNPANYRG